MNKLFILLLSLICATRFTFSKSCITNLGLNTNLYFNNVSTNQSSYLPGDTVQFNIVFNNQQNSETLIVKYFHLDDKLYEQTLTLNQTAAINWGWKTPAIDFQGYLVEIFLMQGDRVLDQTNIAVDVSSTWSYFPRYGFLSNYPLLSQDSIQSVIETLNRFHINGLQFYDWQYKHKKLFLYMPS
ncbi:MAG: glycoside hydrolase family 66 protein [Ignavibacteriaceae bacterium]